MFVAFIVCVCKEINASQSPDVWLVGWQRMVEAYVAEGRGGAVQAGHTVLWSLGTYFWELICWMSEPFFQPLPVAFESADIFGYVNMSLPFSFCALLPVVVWAWVLLSGEHKGSVCEVSHNLWFCACSSLQSRQTDGGREAYKIILQMRSWSPWRWSYLIGLCRRAGTVLY